MKPIRFHPRYLARCLWLAPAIGTLWLAWPFLQCQIQLNPQLLGNPLRFIRENVSPTPAIRIGAMGDDSYLPPILPANGPGAQHLEAEAALAATKQAGWEDLRVNHYSGGAAVYTQKEGAELPFQATVVPGRYRIAVRVWSYEQGKANRLEIRLGNAVLPFVWQSSPGPRLLELTKTVELREGIKEFRVRAVRIGQFALVLDRVSVVPEGMATAGDSWWRYAGILAGWAGLFLGAAGWGAFCWKRLGLAGQGEPFGSLVLQEMLGLGLVATVVTVLGTVGCFRLPVVAGLLGAGCALGCKPWLQTLGLWWAAEVRAVTRWWLVVEVPILLLLAAVAGAALTPAAGVDSQDYHLPIAKWLIAEGRFVYHPFQLFWAYPHNVSNLYAVAQILDNDAYFRTAQLVHASLGLLWFAAVYALGKEWFGRAAGLGAVLLCLGIEGVVFEMGTALADLGFAAFGTTAILAAVRARAAAEDGLRTRWLVLAALLAGAAAVCKVHGPALAIALALAVALAEAFRRGWRAGLAWFCVIGLLSFAVASPMYLKNWLVYGNPLFPFTFLFTNRDLSPEFTRYLFSPDEGLRFLEHNTLPAWKWPYAWVCRRFIDMQSPGPAVLVGLLVLPALGWKWLRKNWPILLLVALLVVSWLLISALTRFAYPWVALLAVLACAPLSWRPRPWLALCTTAVLLACALPVILAQLPALRLKWDHVLGRRPNVPYLATVLEIQNGNQTPPLAGIRLMNEEYHAHPWPGQVLLDTHLVVYADFPHIPSSLYLLANSLENGRYTMLISWPPLLTTTAKKVPDREVLAQLTEGLHVSHVLLSRHGPALPVPKNGMYKDIVRQLVPAADRMDVVLERWARQGLVHKRTLEDSILYSFDEDRVRAALDGETGRTSAR